MSAVADKLREARALIERGWTQDAWARDRKGRDVEDLPNGSHELVCWCAAGAINRVRGGNAAFNALAKIVGGSILRWNDAPERTQAEVLAAFDKAIALAETPHA